METDHILKGTGNKEKLLSEPQFLALKLFIIGIKHLGEIFRSDFFVNGSVVIPHIKALKVKGICGFGPP